MERKWVGLTVAPMAGPTAAHLAVLRVDSMAGTKAACSAER